MGEYEPRDSRIVTNNPSATPIEPQRTGPEEGETRGGSGATAPRQEEPAEGSREDTAEQDRWQAGDTEPQKEEQGQ